MTDDKASIIPANPKDVPSDSRGWATAAQLSGFVSLWIIGPLIIWLIKRDEDAYVEEYAREALNFHISMLIYGIISGILVIVIVGIFMLIALGIFSLIVTIVAAVKAASGDRYRYPMTIRFVN